MTPLKINMAGGLENGSLSRRKGGKDKFKTIEIPVLTRGIAKILRAHGNTPLVRLNRVTKGRKT